MKQIVADLQKKISRGLVHFFSAVIDTPMDLGWGLPPPSRLEGLGNVVSSSVGSGAKRQPLTVCFCGGMNCILIILLLRKSHRKYKIKAHVNFKTPS